MKVIKHIINIVVWSLVALYLLTLLLLRLPAVQDFTGREVATALGNKLGTRVSVGRIDLGFLNRLIIDDVKIYDQQQKLMMQANRLSAKMDFLPLAEGQIAVSSVQIFGARFSLYKPSADAAANFQFIVDSLAPRDTTSHTPINLRINSLIMRHSSIRYDEWAEPPTHGQLNPAHLNVDNISAHIVLKALTDDSLNLNVKKLSFTEQSGLNLRNASFRLEAGRRSATLESLTLKLPASMVSLPLVRANYYMAGTMPSAVTALAFDGACSDSYITPSDLAFLWPGLSTWNNRVNISLTADGNDRRTNISQLELSSDGLRLLANGWVQGSAWHAQIPQATVSADLIARLLQTAKTDVPDFIPQLGDVTISGEAGAADKKLTARGSVSSAVGPAEVDFSMTPDRQLAANVTTSGIDLKALTGNDRLGWVVADIDISGKSSASMEAKGLVSRLDYNNYTYSNIQLSGTHTGNTLSGAVSIDDPNVALSLEGELQRDRKSSVRLFGNVRYISPAALHLTERWGNARLRADIDADFTATSLNDAEGNIYLDDLTMMGDSAYYHLDNLHLRSGYDDNGAHFLKLDSDFAEARLSGTFDYADIAQSLVNIVGSKLPTLPGLPRTNQQQTNDFSLQLNMKKSDWLESLLGIPLSLQQPLSLQAHVDDHTKSLDLTGRLPAFTYNGTAYANGHIDVKTVGDSLVGHLSVYQQKENGGMALGLRANAYDNRLNASLSWNNNRPDKLMSGQINAVGRLYNNEHGKPEALIHIQPSHAMVNGARWEVAPADITYSDHYLMFDRFAVEHDRQHLIVDGVASRQQGDSLCIDLQEVEVAYILDLVNFHAVEFSGEATGKAYITSAFSNLAAHGQLEVSNFKFERGRMGTLKADVDWNKEEKQIDIHAVADDGPNVRTLIDGYVSPSKNFIDLAIGARGTYMDFMHNFTESFLSSITGHADGNLRLAGPLSTINLTGQLVVDGEATVTALNTTYWLRQDTVYFVPDDIQLRHASIYDRNNQRGYLSGGVHHKHLTQLTFDLAVEADNLLAYDFRDFGESSFYGTVFASGNVNIKGRPGIVEIDINVTPQRNSVFVYNAANPDAISNQEFIVWGSRADTVPTPLHEAATPLPVPAVSDNRTDIFLNFRINTTPEATLKLLMDASTNDYITLNGDGNLRASFHNKGAFQMFGTYTVRHGTYGITIQNIIQKNFTFQDGGTIVFGGDPYDAALNLQALYTVQGVPLSDLSIGNSFSSNNVRVNCLMNIGGQPKAPRVDFDIDMPTVNADEKQMIRSVINGEQEMNQQVLYLLGIGRFYSQGANNANAEQSDQTSLAMQSFLSGTLSTQINNVLNQVIKNDDWNFGANISTGNEGWHNAEYEGIINGRMLNNRLLINGQFGYRDNATQASPSFIGDFDIRYLLYPNGNLALKVYNQTNDRYFTRSSLNTQGIGLIMKKDFNGLGDLLEGKKSKKKKKQKK